MARAPKKAKAGRAAARPKPKVAKKPVLKRKVAPAKKKAVAKRPVIRKPVAKKKAAPKKKLVAKKKPAPKKKPVAKKKAPAKKPVTKVSKPARKTVAVKKAGAAQPKRSVPAAAVVERPAPVVVKPVAPKPAPPPPPVKVVPRKPMKPELRPAEIAKVKVALEELRIRYEREFKEIDDQTFNASQSEMSGETSYDEESADSGSFTFEREKDMSIGNNIRDLLDRVNHALGSIKRGTYGLCENCGKPIAKARLLALPYSALCVSCKAQDERIR